MPWLKPRTPPGAIQLDDRLAAAVLLALAAAVIGPTLLRGAGQTDSVIFNTVWVKEFGAALQRGEFPPRWVAGAFNGLGAPSFVYYPPLAFYLAAVVDLLTARQLDPYQLTSATSMILAFAGGLGCYYWLRQACGRGVALAAAAAYVAAPFHLIDNHLRGAFAELAGYAVLPWFAWTLERAATDRRWTPALGATYAALILAHPPIALLGSLLVAPAVVGSQLAATRPQGWAAIVTRCLGGGLLGLALAAGYLGPALLLQDWASMAWIWAADSSIWALLHWRLWPPGIFRVVVAASAIGALALALVALAAAAWRPQTPSARRAILWAGVGILGFIMMIPPWVWGPAYLGKVQFSFRLIGVIEFAAISALALVAAASPGRRWLLAMLGLPLLVFALTLTWFTPIERSVFLLPANPLTRELIALGRVPNEHLPANYATSPDYYEPTLANGFPAEPSVRISGGEARILAIRRRADGGAVVDLEVRTPARVVIKRFFYPTWRVTRIEGGLERPLSVGPSLEQRFVEFTAPPGRATYRLTQSVSPLERRFQAVSVAGAAIVLGLVLAPSFARRRRVAGSPDA